MSVRRKPNYDLVRIQQLVASGYCLITKTAMTKGQMLGFDRQDIIDCVLELDEGDFYKAMASLKFPGSSQDVYKPTFEGIPIYLKLTLGEGWEAVVIQFKRDESK